MNGPNHPGGPAAAFFQDTYAIDGAVLAELLGVALDRGGEYAELYFEYRESGTITFEECVVKNVGGGVMQGLGVRVIQGDAVGYAYTEELTREAMRRAADTAAQISTRDRRVEPVDINAERPPQYYPIVGESIEAAAADKLAVIRRADLAARHYHPSITRVDITMLDETKRVLIATSDGRLAGDVQPLIRINITCLSEIEESRQRAGTGGGGRFGMEYFERVPVEGLAEEAARQAVLLQEAQEAPAGTLPVVLAGGDSGVLLHEAVGHGLEADFNRKKTSTYSDRVGTLVASPLCTIVDDGTIMNSRGSLNMDDEGSPTGTNTLIQDGVLQGYMQDRISARHFGVAPTGNSRRQTFKHYPMPRMTNTYMLAGETPPEEIIASVERGIYCVSYDGGQVNISNGDFVFGVTEGYLIEHGRITAPIRNASLIGNGPDALSKVTKVGTDFTLSDGRWTCGKAGQSVPVGVGMPTVLVSGITVGGTKRPVGGGMS
jgi:TldD protein